MVMQRHAAAVAGFLARSEELELIVPGRPLRIGGSLAAFRAIEQHPGAEVIGEVLEAVRLAGRRKEKVTFRKLNPLITIHEHTAALCHDVNLVASMRRLGVAAARGKQFYPQRAVAEQLGERLTVSGRQLLQGCS